MPNMSGLDEPLALSIVANEPHIHKSQVMDQHCELTCAPAARLISRNAFVIRRLINHQPNRTNLQLTVEYLKYGQDLMLECHAANQHSEPLLVYSMPKNPFISNASNSVAYKSNGELKQFVGLALQKSNIGCNNGKSMVNMGHHDLTSMSESIPNAFFYWRFQHENPEIRYEMIGEKIPVCIIDQLEMYE